MSLHTLSILDHEPGGGLGDEGSGERLIITQFLLFDSSWQKTAFWKFTITKYKSNLAIKLAKIQVN